MALACALGTALADPPAPTRQAELTHLVRNDCGACHGRTLQGGLGPPLVAGCAQVEPRGSGDLGVIVERASGSLQVVDATRMTSIGTVTGLGDLSHASVVYSRDGRYAYVFGRDGGLTKVDLLRVRIERRVVQSGIGGAISQDGRLVAAANYTPGGVRVFDAQTLEMLADIPAVYGANGQRAKVVGLEDAAGSRFAFSLFEAGEIWVADLSAPRAPVVRVFGGIASPGLHMASVQVSALLWSAAFGLYAVRYWPVLTRPRLDGKPG